jgi:hypothetical protein
MSGLDAPVAQSPTPSSQEFELLQSKVQSKMLVATFLGGFTFAALLELVKDPDDLAGQGLLTLFAIVALIGALGMFIGAVYIYDFLSTPLIYWRPERQEETWPVSIDTMYQEMKRAWVRCFTPAVALATAGFLLIVARSGSLPVLIICVIVLVAVVVYWWCVRPRYGLD